MAIIGLIPARGGSKGIPGKNIAPCGGKPLLAYTAEAALAAKCLDRVMLSTDDPGIAAVGRKCGLEVSFLRPAELATDKANSLSVIVHALDWLESQGSVVDAIVLLQPTSPLRTAHHIREAVSLFHTQKPDALVSVAEVPHQYHPNALMRLEQHTLVPVVAASEMILRRQDVSPLYARNGPAILILSASQIRSGSFYSGVTAPYVMSQRDSLDIDTMEDLAVAAASLARSSPA
jgi:CMP-N,N'-diacetyllegionaminic acid synthase